MKRSVIHPLAVGLVGLAATLGTAFGDTPEAHVKFLGCETSNEKFQDGKMPKDWGDTTESGIKTFWRSTSTPAKTYVIEGNANAYGLDGYFCGTCNDLSQEGDASDWRGALYTGTRTLNMFGNITEYASLEVITSSPGGAKILAQDPGIEFDRPTASVGETVSRVQSADVMWSFGNGEKVFTELSVDALRITFNTHALLYPVVRIGFACSRGDDQDPLGVVIRDEAGNACSGDFVGSSDYGLFHWVFFEVANPMPGETLTVSLTNRLKSRNNEPNERSTSAALTLVAFDSVGVGGSPSAPTILSAEADRSELELGKDPVEVVLTATAGDPNGSVLTYTWLADGEQPGDYELGETVGGVCTAVLKETGTYRFVAKVVNENGLMALSEPVVIQVEAAFIPPEGKAVVFLGTEVSAQNRYQGTPGEYPATRGAWRSTATVAKPWILPGNANAYGLDGYLCGSVADTSQESQGSPWKGMLYTGTRSDMTFTAVTPYASVTYQGCYHRGDDPYLQGNDGAATLDNPRLAIGPSVNGTVQAADIQWSFGDTSAQSEVTALTITFNAAVVDYPIVRIGFVTDRQRNEIPAEIIVTDKDGNRIVGTVPEVGYGAYGYINWTFFEVQNAEPGDVLTVSVKNALNQDGTTWSAQAMLGAIAFDSHFSGSNVAPEITSLSATPESAVYANFKAETTLSVVAEDGDGDELSYFWESVGTPSGGTCEIATPHEATSVVTMSGAGAYSFKVSVTDSKGETVDSDPIVVTVTAAADAAYVEFVGAESSFSPGADNGNSPMVDASDCPWGEAGTGNKCSFRSLAAGAGEANRKAFVFDGRPNAYGVDGYLFPGNNIEKVGDQDVEIGPICSGAYDAETMTASSMTEYLSSFVINKADVGWTPQEGSLFKGCYWIDDPRKSLADWVDDVKVGWIRFSCQPGNFKRIATMTFNGKVSRCERVRIGILDGYGENWRPIRLKVGGVAHDWVQVNGDYSRPDWQFFDLVGVKPGDQVDILAMGSSVDRLAIEGFVFDSKPAKRSGLTVIIR